MQLSPALIISQSGLNAQVTLAGSRLPEGPVTSDQTTSRVPSETSWLWRREAILDVYASEL